MHADATFNVRSKVLFVRVVVHRSALASVAAL